MFSKAMMRLLGGVAVAGLLLVACGDDGSEGTFAGFGDQDQDDDADPGGGDAPGRGDPEGDEPDEQGCSTTPPVEGELTPPGTHLCFGTEANVPIAYRGTKAS